MKKGDIRIEKRDHKFTHTIFARPVLENGFL